MFMGGVLFDSEPTILVAHVDGGSRGNPGPAGYGVVIQDETGRPLDKLSGYLGRQTNNYAEYSGLLAALDYALEHGPRALKVISDSELLVKQINGQYKVSSPALRELYEQARRKIHQLERFEIRHVLREKNREADRLANLAMDRGTGKQRVTEAASGAEPREVNGVVRNGVVQFLGEPLPDGALVKIRAAK
jgi:ribonuclease HI